MGSLRSENTYLKNLSPEQYARAVMMNARSSSQLEMEGKRVCPIYDFSKPEDAANFMLALPKRAREDWKGWFLVDQGPEFVEAARKIAISIVAERKAKDSK